jgi:hypothetical protein
METNQSIDKKTYHSNHNKFRFFFPLCIAGVSLLIVCNGTSPLTPSTTYHLSVIAGTGGTITAPTQLPASVAPGVPTVITAHANAGYAFAAWTDTSQNASISYKNAASTTVKLVSGDAVIEAKFIQIVSPGTPIDISTFEKESGANFLYYMGTWTSLPDFSVLSPDSSGPCDSLNVNAISHQAHNFGVVISGYFDIPIDGDYTFYLNSADGSVLLLNDSIIINNDGIHATPVEGTTVITLMQGTYLIGVRYFNASSTPSLSVSYACQDIGITKTTIPNGALSRPFTGPVPKIIVKQPAEGEIYHLGDTIHVRWIYRNFAGQVFAELSVNNGRTFSLISTEAFAQADTNGYYDWPIPVDTAFATQSAIIRVRDYPPLNNFGLSGKFSIAQ